MSEPSTATSTDRGRLAGLDGIRGVAALFVMLHHCWLMTYPGFPANIGPWWTGWLLYGHFSVVVFIVLSGFSLAVAPARRGWQLGSLKTFAQRRAWRILPPYWAALVFSLIIAWTIMQPPGEPKPNLRTVAVYGLLFQDAFDAPYPNGAFWSIAIEAHLYILLPLLLLMIRRVNAAVMVAAVTVVVVPIGALASTVPAADLLMRFVPQFAVLFALGAVAAGIVAAPERIRRLPWHWFSLAAAVPVLAVIVVQGSVWTVHQFFWIDLALAPATAMLLAAVATGRPGPLVRLLDTRPGRSLGSFSYSLYLTHAPIVLLISQKVVSGHVPAGVPAFLTTVALSAPLTVLFARAFATVFEFPFQRYRSWAQLRPALPRLGRRSPVQPHIPAHRHDGTPTEREAARTAAGEATPAATPQLP